MCPRFDEVMGECFEAMFGKGVPALKFLRKYRDCFLLYISEQDYEQFKESLDKETSPPLEVMKRGLGASSCLAMMFKDVAHQIDYDQYVRNIDKRLVDLEFNGFTKEEVVSFKGIMLRSSADMLQNGHKSFEKKNEAISFLGADVVVTTTSVDDDWEYRYHAKCKSLALNAVALRMLPWESILYSRGELPGVAQTVRPEASLLEEYSNVGDVVINTLGNGPHTFQEMRRITSSHAKAWMGLDRSFSLEYAFLLVHAEKICTQQVHRAVLDALPSEGQHKGFSHVLLKLQEICMSPRCLAIGGSSSREVDGVYAMVGGLDEGISVDSKDLSKFSDFYKLVVARLQFFYKREESGPSAGPFKRDLVGTPALMDLYEWVDAVKKDNVVVDMKTIQPLRTFTWLLSAPQVVKVNEWVSAATLAYAGMLSKMLSDKASGAEGDNLAVVAAGSSLVVPPAKKSKKLNEEGTCLGGSQKKSLMQFFVPKGKK
mgnify:CR=1 FL=1